ncbi:DUF2155 domain-containing protein, partial [Sphingomonas bacterium]|uniref:DUF2155 domain-containing protein n=1 Tax=Sphingomonas bacterium TaxID=1895847 RepID=UPI00262B7518
MNWRRVAGVAAALAGASAAGWAGYQWYQGPSSSAPVAAASAPATTLDDTTVSGGVETVDVSGDPTNPEAGTTPMKDRVAVLGLLNKRNGLARDLTLKPGQAMRIGNVVVRLRACEQTAPWEQEQLTGAFVQVLVRGVDKHWRRTFSGWLYKERPALNAVEHPIYDVWTKSCAMTFPATGPDTAPVADALPAKRSSARKSPAAAEGAAEAAPT